MLEKYQKMLKELKKEYVRLESMKALEKILRKELEQCK